MANKYVVPNTNNVSNSSIKCIQVTSSGVGCASKKIIAAMSNPDSLK